MMSIKVMAVANVVVDVVEVVGLDEVMAATTTAKRTSCKEIDDCTHIKDQYMSKTL